jgi:uncharacterized protein YhfF
VARGHAALSSPAATIGRVTADELFAEYAAAAGLPPDAAFDEAFSFGDSAEMADQLALLVRDGPKRATAGLVAEMEALGAPMPQAGGHSVVLDGRGEAVCVIRTTETRIGPLASVDDAFAWDEGEGDRTRADWLDGHLRAFARSCARLGIAWSDDLPVHFERFELVWPRPTGQPPAAR